MGHGQLDVIPKITGQPMIADDDGSPEHHLRHRLVNEAHEILDQGIFIL
jgi:hypothetical protein